MQRQAVCLGKNMRDVEFTYVQLFSDYIQRQIFIDMGLYIMDDALVKRIGFSFGIPGF
jgi:hypothetical protein